MHMIEKCLGNYSGFAAVVKPAPDLDGFAVDVHYKGEGDTRIRVIDISSVPPGVIQCPGSNLPRIVTSGTVFTCSKPKEQNILVTMNTNRGDLKGVTLYGTDTTLQSLQNQVDSLSQRIDALDKKPQPRFNHITLPSGVGGQCQVIQDLQMCWGAKQATPNPTSAFNDTIIFPTPFDGLPDVILGPEGTNSQRGYGYVIYWSEVLNNQVSYLGVESRGRADGQGPVNVNYIAIGKAKP